MPMEIAGLEVERVTSGAPPRARPILFLHGMWGGSWMWDHYLSFFAGRGYTGYALNLRGHHGSKPVDDIGRVPFADYLADARAVAASIGDPIIVGHSMGGLLAQKLAELGELLREQAAHRVADDDRVADRRGDRAGVGEVVGERHAADVVHGLRAVMAAQVEGVAGVATPREEAEVVVPHPAPAPHAVEEQDRPRARGGARRHALHLEAGDLHRHPARF